MSLGYVDIQNGRGYIDVDRFILMGDDFCSDSESRRVHGYVAGVLRNHDDSNDPVRPMTAKINRIIVNGPCTIVFWDDNTKTMVRRSDDDKDSNRTAIIYAIAKKKFGNTSRIHRAVDRFAKTNAQRVAILNYIVANDGFDVDDILKKFCENF